MISVCKANIPSFLADSDLAKVLNADDNTHYELPIQCCKFDLDLTEPEAFRALLSTCSFWGVQAVPKQLIQYCLSDNVIEAAEEFAEFADRLPFLSTLQQMKATDTADWLSLAVCAGYLSVVEYLLGCGGHQLDSKHCAGAAQHGHMDILTYLHNCEAPWDVTTCAAAASSGNLPCLQYAHENGCPWDSTVCAQAARYGHLECLRYAREHGCEWDERTIAHAVTNGHVDCLDYVWAQWGSRGRDLYIIAALTDQVECMEYFYSHGAAPWIAPTTIAAAHGSLRCLQWQLQHGQMGGAKVCDAAARHNQLACLKYAHEHGAPLYASAAIAAAQRGHLDCLKYALDSGCLTADEMQNEAPDAAAKILERGNRICNAAFRGDHPDCLQYAQEHGCSWDETNPLADAEFSHLDLLNHLREHGFP